MGRLSTHILDTAHGLPAAGVEVRLSRRDGPDWRHVKTVQTNADGRTDAPLLAGAELVAGVYRLEFAIGDHFRRRGMKLAEPPFVDHVVLQANDRPDWRDASRFEAQVFPRRAVAEVASLIQDDIP